MSSPPPITSHSTPKTKENNNNGQQKRPPPKEQPNSNYLYKPPYVSDWSYTTQKMCIKPDFHIHALNNNLRI